MVIEQFFNFHVDKRFNGSFIKKMLSGSWFTVKRPITRGDVEEHLNGNNWVGVRRATTPYFIVDIDAHTEDGVGSKYYRIQRITECFSAKPLWVQSSSSGGLHLYYFLDKEYPVERIQEVVKTVLLNKGVVLEPGTVEIFPSRKRPIRLPLGAGSFLVDDDLRKIGFSTEETMDIFLEYGTDEKHQVKLEVLGNDIEQMVPGKNYSIGLDRGSCSRGSTILDKDLSSRTGKDLDSLDKVCSSNRSTILDKVLCSSTSTYIYKEKEDTIAYSSQCTEPAAVQELWNCGLTEAGTRNAATRILISDCYRSGLSQDDAYTKIHDWLCSKNNGNSEDWTNRSEWVLSNLWTMIQKRYALGGLRAAALTIEDVKQLLLLVNDNYKQLQFCYSLLLHFKSIGKDTLNISKKTLCSFAGSCNTTYQQRIRFCLQSGLVEVSKEYWFSPELKRAREYRCLFRLSESNNLVSSVEQAVMEILGAAEVKRRFGRYRFDEVQKVLGEIGSGIYEAKSG